jgi:hypothetical protein
MVAGITAGGAFLLSFIFSLLGSAIFQTALTRALIFAGLFFGLVAGIYFLYDKFLQPKEGGGKDENQTGQNVDYSVGDGIDWTNGNTTDNGVPGNVSNLNGADVSPIEELEELGDDGHSGATHDSGGLEQIDNNKYSNERVLTESEKADASSQKGYSVDMSAFTPEDVPKSGKPAGPERRDTPGGALREGTVDMSVERRSGKTELGFEVDGKKIAGAIQTLLKKDEG